MDGWVSTTEAPRVTTGAVAADLWRPQLVPRCQTFCQSRRISVLENCFKPYSSSTDTSVCGEYIEMQLLRTYGGSSLSLLMDQATEDCAVSKRRVRTPGEILRTCTSDEGRRLKRRRLRVVALPPRAHA